MLLVLTLRPACIWAGADSAGRSWGPSWGMGGPSDAALAGGVAWLPAWLRARVALMRLLKASPAQQAASAGHLGAALYAWLSSDPIRTRDRGAAASWVRPVRAC